jgi:hypothetical protein
VSILWPVLVAALLPLNVHNIAAHLPNLLTRIAAMDGKRRAQRDRSRPHQVDDFRSQFASKTRAAKDG